MADRSSDDPKLPQDVVVEVLKRLPVDSLLRFRCVSRSWRSTIDDPRFVALHLNHSALDASNWYLLCLHLWNPVQRFCSLFSNESLNLPSRSQIEIPFVAPPNCYDIVGSCNGLICVTDLSDYGYGQTMYLWNLFTRKHKPVRPSGPEHQIFPIDTALGFGFDARSNDYKIVRIFYFPADRRPCFGGTNSSVEIYSLSTDSWRSMECEVPFCFSGRAVFLNGNLHWFVDRWEDGGCATVVSFDVAGEVFDEIALPEEISLVDDGSLMVYVAELNDLLAVLVSFNDVVVNPEWPPVCSVWVMREYGEPESWTKLYSFEPCGMVIGFDGFTRNGELLIKMLPGGRVSWNPITRKFANLPLSKQCHLVTVVESLVSH